MSPADHEALRRMVDTYGRLACFVALAEIRTGCIPPERNAWHGRRVAEPGQPEPTEQVVTTPSEGADR